MHTAVDVTGGEQMTAVHRCHAHDVRIASYGVFELGTGERATHFDDACVMCVDCN